MLSLPLEAVIVWIILATAVGLYAGRRGHDPVPWALSSMVVSPLIGWIVLLAVGDGEGVPETNDAVGEPAASPSSASETLAELASLADQGLITEDEYQDKRREVLARL